MCTWCKIVLHALLTFLLRATHAHTHTHATMHSKSKSLPHFVCLVQRSGFKDFKQLSLLSYRHLDSPKKTRLHMVTHPQSVTEAFPRQCTLDPFPQLQQYNDHCTASPHRNCLLITWLLEHQTRRVILRKSKQVVFSHQV